MNRIRCLPTLSVWQAHRIALRYGLRLISTNGRACLVPRTGSAGIFAAARIHSPAHGRAVVSRLAKATDRLS